MPSVMNLFKLSILFDVAPHDMYGHLFFSARTMISSTERAVSNSKIGATTSTDDTSAHFIPEF
jgi:hypothetical protein